MTETPEPTPTSDVATEDARESPLAIVNRRIQNRGMSERLLMDLTDAGYRIVRATPAAGGAVTVPLDDLRAALDAMVYVQDTYFWEKWNYQEPFDRLTAIAASGGRHDGE